MLHLINLLFLNFAGCDFASSSSSQLRTHLVICDFARQTNRLKCVFCNRLFKQASSLITHLHSHGPDRFECSICHWKGPLQSRIVAHMKISHKITNIDLKPVNILEQDLEKHQFIIFPKVSPWLFILFIRVYERLYY